jgi:hypothetical protein
MVRRSRVGGLTHGLGWCGLLRRSRWGRSRTGGISLGTSVEACNEQVGPSMVRRGGARRSWSASFAMSGQDMARRLRRAWARLVTARNVTERRLWCGIVRHGMEDLERKGWAVEVGPCSAESRPGVLRRSRRDAAGFGLGVAAQVKIRRSGYGNARQGMARRGRVRSGSQGGAVSARRVAAWPDMSRRLRRHSAGLG